MSTSYVIKTGLTASTNTSYTISMWVKFTKTSVASGSPYMWSCGAQGSGAQGLYINNSDMKLGYYGHSGYTSHSGLSDGSLRDCSGWYHIVWSVNAGTGTCYINGVQQGSTRTGIAPLNAHGGTEMALNTYVGTSYSTYDDLGPLMSHVHFIDGTAYPATTFGETDSTTGEWKIKTSPSVTYGTNGFFLFKDNASVNDQSGNGNNFTATGTVTQTEDNPSNVFATFNPLMLPGSMNYINGNTSIRPQANSVDFQGASTLAFSSGKWYVEFKYLENDGHQMFGISTTKGCAENKRNDEYVGETASGVSMYGSNGNIYENNSTTSYGSGWGNNSIIMMAVDADNNKIYFGNNGTWYNSGNPSTGTNGYSYNATNLAGFKYIVSSNGGVGYDNVDANFGNGYFGTTAISSEGTNASGLGKFEYDVPTGFTALCTKGLNL